MGNEHKRDNDGFTTVRRRKGGNNYNDKGNGFKSWNNGYHNQIRRNIVTTRYEGRDRVEVNDKHTRDRVTDSLNGNQAGASAIQRKRNGGQQPNDGIVIEDGNEGSTSMKEHNSGQAGHSKPKKQVFSVVETNNRFSLLDEEGNILGNHGDETVNMDIEEGIPNSLNDGWVKKQERILNTRFNTRLSQEQRFEAKKYVIDKLVPLQPILSGWPKTLREYFRSLCNLYNFGEGYLAAAYETEYIEDQEIHNMHGAEESMEEVFSETDATAKFMTSDIQGSYHHTELNDVVLPEGQAREGHEMTLEDVHVTSN
ncbi:hypothetical protein L1987_39811 [Smallanthus sonchifolius]|uniref:Uncharacterized protein n=1 Tax=Smallanthus sonchifolius TaxID=185202 RepID=A0ACB9HP73_9ASTR|nr:hypothetical protein L1987_39811 [Smallanthus sonchifolius]